MLERSCEDLGGLFQNAHKIKLVVHKGETSHHLSSITDRRLYCQKTNPDEHRTKYIELPVKQMNQAYQYNTCQS